VDADEQVQQQRLHEAIEDALNEEGVLDGLVLAGWVIAYETVALDDEVTAHAGTIYGPHEMTTWRALGLIEWARRWSLEPGTRDE
jgi:hypothetical protein